MPPYFLFFLLLISIPTAYATSVTAYVLPPGETLVENDEAVLDPGETLDVSQNVKTVPETTETVGGVEVELTKEVKFQTSDGEELTIENSALPSIVIEIPDDTTVSAPDSWNGEITPPTQISTSGTITGNFLTPTSAISVGSPDVVLVFDTPVTLVLNGTTGTTAYKIPGATEWIIISGCTGTFENPKNPTEPGECSISDGTNTKILTYHFTEFTGLTTATSTPTTPSTGNSGGHGNTGVGSPRVFGGSSGSSGGGTYYGPSGTVKQSVFPTWFDGVTDWYREGKISALEFLNAYQWIIENVMK